MISLKTTTLSARVGTAGTSSSKRKRMKTQFRRSQSKQTAFGNSDAESQRDSGAKPRVARNELPWGKLAEPINPNGVAARRCKPATTPLGLKPMLHKTQGSSFLATLGWLTQSPWDCRT